MKKVITRIITILVLALAVRGCVVEPVRISDDAMAPTLWAGDVILVEKISFGLRIPGPGALIADWSHIRRGDLVLVSDVGEPPMTLIRRVIAVPGDKVDFATAPGGDTVLKAREYLVAMDQKPKELGGRDMRILVSRQAIVGKAWRIWIPADSKVESGEPRNFLQRI